MEQFFISLSEILSFLMGEEVVLKPFSVLSSEIAALIGQTEFAWLPYFLSPQNITSLFVYGGLMYAMLFILMYLPWRLFRALIPLGHRKKSD